LIDTEGRNIRKLYLNWVKHVERYWKRKEDWCLAWRDYTTHGHQTNNFSEVNVRLFKNIVLNRTKTFNAISLIHFIVNGMEKYFRDRLGNYANGRCDKARLLLKKHIKGAENIPIEKVIPNVVDDTYIVIDSDEWHTVDCRVGCCTCSVGRLGRFCLHQAATLKYYKLKFPNLPTNEVNDSRYNIAVLAYDDKAREKTYYASVFNYISGSSHDVSDSPPLEENKSTTIAPSINSPQVDVNPKEEFSTAPCQQVSMVSQIEDSDVRSKNLEYIRSISEKFYSALSDSALTKYAESLKSATKYIKARGNIAVIEKKIFELPRRKNNVHSTIGVQPTALMRRQVGTLRGKKRKLAGRTLNSQLKSKRPHNLAYNVKNNLPHPN